MNGKEWTEHRLALRRTTQHKITYRYWRAGERWIKPIFFHLYENVLQVIPYGHPQRVYHRILFHTGCRPSEVWKGEAEGGMDYANIQIDSATGDGVLWWERGKDQGGWRHENLPVDLIREIEYMMRTYGSRGTKIFTRNYSTLRREFNRDWRPLLCDQWNEKYILPPGMKEKQKAKWKKFSDPFVYNLKCYRKTFITIRLCQHYLDLKSAGMDSWDQAMSNVRDDLGHASKKMTQDHYVACIKELGALEYAREHPITMRWIEGQQRMMAYL